MVIVTLESKTRGREGEVERERGREGQSDRGREEKIWVKQDSGGILTA